jgi:dimethylamine monooxygenase subunit A
VNASLADLFPEGDYRFHLTLRRAEPRAWFAPSDPSGRVLAERALWLANEPARCAALLPESEPLLEEFATMVRDWNVATSDPLATGRGYESLLKLGRSLEPDILLLSPDAEGCFRLRGGALCFPTGWALEDKMGHTLDFIHDVVPGLNRALGASIHQFLSKLKPGVAFLRDNWGFAATDELNLHPARAIAPPGPPVALDRLWLRVEQQALVGLPETGGIVFGIRIVLHRLDTLAGTAAGTGLRRGLATMPAELAAYKRLDTVRAEILKLL